MREKSMPKTRGEAIIKNRYCINLVSVIIERSNENYMLKKKKTYIKVL